MPKKYLKEEQLPRWLKSKPKPLTFKKEQIDAENGIIRDVIMCEVGEAKGHDMHLEQEFIKDLVGFDNANFTKFGVKARFGHPGMSDTTMGKQMGYFRNCRVRGNEAIADLHLLDSANISPTHPNLKDWMLSIADEAPEFIMCSIVFMAGGYYQKSSGGEKKYCYYYKETKDEDGEVYHRWVSADEDLGNVFVEFGEHYYTDLVEAGAATNSLFSEQFNQDKFAVRAIEWVRENEDIHQFLQANPAKLVDFAKQLGVALPNAKITLADKWKALKELFVTDIEDDESDTALNDATAKIAELTEQINNATSDTAKLLTTHVADVEALNAAHQTALTEKTTRIDELEKEVTTLKAYVPEGHTVLEKGGTSSGKKLKPKNLSPQTERAITAYNKRKKR